jgi:hypothetical protein
MIKGSVPIKTRERMYSTAVDYSTLSIYSLHRHDRYTVRLPSHPQAPPAGAHLLPLPPAGTRSDMDNAAIILRSSDGPDGGRNPLGHALFDQQSSRPLRSAAAGEILVPLRGCRTLLNTAATIWNRSPALRSATTLAMATRAANAFAKSVPIM